MSPTVQSISRRSILKGAAATAGVTALAACAPDSFDGSGIQAQRVGRVPDADPNHHTWGVAPATTIALGPQDLVLPQKLAPTITEVRVRAVHDGSRIGFLLEWEDADVNDLTVRVDDFRDACAVLLAPGEADAALRTMGATSTPATLLHWKADWQRDVDFGRQGVEAVYPNRSIDVYTPLWNVAPLDVEISSYVDAGATEWLPGLHVENPMSAAEHTTPVEKAIAYGFSTTFTAPTQDTRGRGVRTDKGWRVAISKPLGSADVGELALHPGSTSTCAFAVWSGAFHDAGSRKAPSITVHALNLAP